MAGLRPARDYVDCTEYIDARNRQTFDLPHTREEDTFRVCMCVEM